MERDLTKYEINTLKDYFAENSLSEDWTFQAWLKDLSWSEIDEICHPEEDEYYGEDKEDF